MTGWWQGQPTRAEGSQEPGVQGREAGGVREKETVGATGAREIPTKAKELFEVVRGAQA